MQSLIAYFSKQHLFVNLVTLFVIAWGTVSMLNINRESFPNIDFEVITVTTIYPNAAADSVETLVTTPLETRIKEVEGIKETSSVSTEGRSVISVTLDPDQTTLDKAKIDIEDAVQGFSELPEDAIDPVVNMANSKRQSVITLALAGSVSRDKLRDVANWVIRGLESLDGVAAVEKEGYPDKEISILIDQAKMRRHGVTLKDIAAKLRSARIDMPGGTIPLRTGANLVEYSLRTQLFADTPEAISQLVLRTNLSGRRIRISDVATVQETFAKEEILRRSNGAPGIGITIYKKTKADSIELSEAVRNYMSSAPLGEGISWEVTNDRSIRVSQRAGVLSGNLLIGLALVLIILSIMLPVRVALIAAIGIPFSFLATMILFELTGISLNLISMMGLIIVIGMLVDDAIVVTENIQRGIDSGLSPEEAAKAGATEIWRPVATSVLTTLVAFLPLMFMSGIFGKFVQYIPVGVIFALLVSLVECFFILPSHLVEWTNPKMIANYRERRIAKWWDNTASPAYRSFVARSLRWRYLISLGALVFTGVSIYIAINHMSYQLFPGSDKNEFAINYELPPGVTLEASLNQAEAIEKAVKASGNEVQSFLTTVGMQSRGRQGSARGSRYGQVYVTLADHITRAKDVDRVMADIKGRLGPLKTDSLLIDFEKGRSGPRVGRDVSLEITGEDKTQLGQAAAAALQAISQVEGLTDLRSSETEGKTQLVIELDEVALMEAGVNKRDVAESVMATRDGIIVDRLQKPGEEVEVRLRMELTDSPNMDWLKGILVPAKDGHLVTIESIAKLTEKRGTESIAHKEGMPILKVEGGVDRKVITSQKANEMIREKILPQLQAQFPYLYFSLGGAESDRAESFASLRRAFVVAIIGIFMLLVLQFSNLTQPLIIAAIVPLGIIAVIWAFLLHGMPLSFLGVIGMIALSGVIVNNAIVFIDFFNRARGSGCSLDQAILDAAKERLRPIVLTTATTVAGILPTAYGLGGYDAFVVPIAIALGWGMLSGSFLTLVVLPSFLRIWGDFVARLDSMRGNHSQPEGVPTTPGGQSPSAKTVAGP